MPAGIPEKKISLSVFFEFNWHFLYDSSDLQSIL
jgi:hypothetical protein